MNNDIGHGIGRERILEALGRLDACLRDRGVTGEICLYGGTVMVLVFNARLSTQDVDAVFAPAAAMREASHQVADELGLPEQWLNDGVKGFVSASPEHTGEGLPQFANLRLLRPTARYLLAMKCLAARSAGYDTAGDLSDIRFLLGHLDIRSVDAALAILAEFYPPERILPKTQFMLAEILSGKATP